MNKVNKEKHLSLSQRQDNVFPKPNLSDFGMSLLSLLEAEFKFQRRGESSMRLLFTSQQQGSYPHPICSWVTMATGRVASVFFQSPFGNAPLPHW